jgi:hypothetical protein
MLSYWQNNVSEKFLPPINYKKKIDNDPNRRRNISAQKHQSRHGSLSSSQEDANALSQEILSLKQATGYLKKQKSKKHAALTAAEQGKTYITEDDVTATTNF